MISVVLCCRNERHSIARAVAAVERQADEAGEPVEILIACNRSTDGTEEVVRTFPHTRILLNGNHHSGVLHNLAMRRCQGDLILFLDGDMVLGPGSLAALRRSFADPGVAGLCGYKWAELEHLDYIDKVRDLVYHAKSRKPRLRDRTPVTFDHPYTMTGGIFALRRSALAEVGGYDPSFRRYACEDLYVEVNLLNRGWSLCYDPAVTACHQHKHASVREFLWRAYDGMPRGVAHLVQRCAELGLRLPFERYMLNVPIHTTGLLLLGIVGWALGGPAWLALAGAAAEGAALVTFFTTRPGGYGLATRLGAAAFWLTSDVGRMVFCGALLFRRLAPESTSEVVIGVVERPGVAPERIEQRVEHRVPRLGGVAFRLRLARVLADHWASMARGAWRALRPRPVEGASGRATARVE